MTRHDDDIPVELREVAAQLRALGPEEWEPAVPPPLRVAVPERAPAVAVASPPPSYCPAVAAAAALALVALGAAGGALIAGGGETAPSRAVRSPSRPWVTGRAARTPTPGCAAPPCS